MMKSKIFFCFVALVARVVSQTATVPVVGTATSIGTVMSIATAQTTTLAVVRTATTPVQIWTVIVGKGGNTFKPQVLQTNVNDVVEFQFFPANHSVVRAEYQYPCIPYELVNPGKQGFFSGFQPVDAVLANPPVWRLTINDTQPIFFYCSAPGACIDSQMVGLINANASVNIKTQIKAAKDSKYMLQPGDSLPSEQTGTIIPDLHSATSIPTPSSTSFASSTFSVFHRSISGGAIAGIVIGVIVAIGLAAALFFFVGRARTLKETVNRQQFHPSVMSMSDPGHVSSVYPSPSIEKTYHKGGMVYIPVTAANFHRASLPLYHQSPTSSHGPQSNQTVVSHYDVGSYSRASPPVHQRDMDAGPNMQPTEMCAAPSGLK